MHAFLFGAIVVGGSIALSVLGMWLVRLKFKPTSLKEHHEVAGYLLSIIARFTRYCSAWSPWCCR